MRDDLANRLLTMLRPLPDVFRRFTAPLDMINDQTTVSDTFDAILKFFRDACDAFYKDYQIFQSLPYYDDIYQRINEAGKLVSIYLSMLPEKIVDISIIISKETLEEREDLKKIRDIQKSAAFLLVLIRGNGCYDDKADDIIVEWTDLNPHPMTGYYFVQEFFKLNPSEEQVSGRPQEKIFNLAVRALEEHDQSKSSPPSFFLTKTNTKKAFENIGINFKDYDAPRYLSLFDRARKLRKDFMAQMTQRLRHDPGAAQGRRTVT